MHLESKAVVGALALGALITSTTLATSPPAYSAPMFESSYKGNWDGLYPNSDSLLVANCRLCHVNSGGGNNYNSYGWKMKEFMDGGASVSSAILQCEPLDSDENPAGSTNLEEIEAGAQPGWTPGPHNTTHLSGGLTLVNQSPPTLPGELDPPLWSLYGCGTNPAGSMSVVSGEPLIGTTFVVGLDNPLGSQTAPAATLLFVGLAPAPGFPCGILVPGLGMSGPFGELLFSNPIASLIGNPWTTPGTPGSVSVPVPPNPPLVGLTLYFQGVLVSNVNTLTEGLQVTIGN